MKNVEKGNVVKTKQGDTCIIVEINKEREGALAFNLSKMHPQEIKLKDIEKIIKDDNCKVVVEKIPFCDCEEKEPINSIDDEDEQELGTEAEEIIEELLSEVEEAKDEMIKTLRDENAFLKDLITKVTDSSLRSGKHE